MDASPALTDSLLAAATVLIFFFVAIYCLYRVVQWARRQRKRAYVVGAVFAPFMAMGKVTDPDDRIVHEAKQLKKREEDDPGDPPETESEDEVDGAR